LNIKKIVASLIIINILQILIILMTWFSISALDRNVNQLYFYLSIGLILFSSIVTTVGLQFANKYKNENLVESIRNLEELNTRLRSQRHDYLNHIQVVYGLLELKEYEEAKGYLNPVFKDIMNVSKALKTAQPAVNALLQIKMETAEKNGIDFYLEVCSDLKNIPMEPWNLCKVLANIIDNSITCLMQVDKPRNILIEIAENMQSYSIQITNNGPQIPKNHLTDIFKQGFTTKNEQGHGMGLYIVSKIIEDAGGRIEVASLPDKTNFCIRIPKQLESKVSYKLRNYDNSEGKRHNLGSIYSNHLKTGI